MQRTLLVVVVLLFAQVVVAAPVASADTTCTQDWRPAEQPVYLSAEGMPTSPAVAMPPPPDARYLAFHVFCDEHYVNSVWRAPSANELTVSRMSVELVARAQFPTVRPFVNPAVGITGLASWFWAERTADPVRMLPGNGPGVDLELRVDTVRWRFGDGTPGTVRGLGTPYPAPSPIRHVFERTGAYTVAAEVRIVGRVRFEELDFDTPSGGHTVELRHEVAQVRSLLHAR